MSIRGRVIHRTLTKLSPGARLQSQMLPPAADDLVFVGDGLSLHGEWAEWFPDSFVRTLGDEILLIDDAREIVAAVDSPRALVLMVGTADLLGMGGSKSAARAVSKLDALVGLATGRLDPASVFVVGVPLRPELGARAAEFNTRAAELVAARGATFVPAPSFAGDDNDGYLVTGLRWDAAVYVQLAQDLASAIGIAGASGRGVSPLTEVGDGFVAKMERKRAQLFESLPAPTGRVVLFGDSITEGGFWEAWLPGMRTANRGIGGDVVAQLTARVDSAIDSPAVVSVLAGTNDLVRGDPKDAESIGQRFHELIAQIRQRDANVPILINSVMPRGKKYIDTITTINDRYREIATEFDAHYLDLWPTLATPERTLRKELTPDGLHLNGVGYRAWVSVLKPALEQLLPAK
jgi:lysophospholipase L1-like esterase